MIDLFGVDVVDAVCGAVVGIVLYRLGKEEEPRWELDKRPSETGVELWAVKGKKETCLHRIAYNRETSKHPETPFDEQFADGLAKARSFIRSMNSSERE